MLSIRDQSTEGNKSKQRCCITIINVLRCEHQHQQQRQHLQTASTHKSAKTYTSIFLRLVTLTFWPQYKRVSRTHHETFLSMPTLLILAASVSDIWRGTTDTQINGIKIQHRYGNNSFKGLFSMTTWVRWHQKGNPFWILMKKQMTG